MRGLLESIAGWFVSWWGVVVLGALDSSVLFWLPLALDGTLVVLTAREPALFWLYPLLATAGSVGGAAVTYEIGRRAGEKGLERFVPKRKLEPLKRRVKTAGAVAMALPAMIPPPFPYKPIILACGALAVSRRHFFIALAVARLVRFGTASVLALLWGEWILRVIESETFERVVIALIVVFVAGTSVTIWRLVRSRRS